MNIEQVDSLQDSEVLREYLQSVSEEELMLELERRKAFDLKEQFDKQVAIGRFVQENREILLKLAKLLESKLLINLLSDEHNLWGQAMSIDFSLYEDDILYDKCYPRGGGEGAIWDKFERT